MQTAPGAPSSVFFILPLKVKKMEIFYLFGIWRVWKRLYKKKPFSTQQNLEISEIRAKIIEKLLKTSNIKQKFRLRRAKSVKNNLNTVPVFTSKEIAARRAAIF